MLQLTTVDTGSVSHVPVQVNMHHNIDAINNCHFSSENIDQSILCNETTDSVSRLTEIKQKNPCNPSFAYINVNSIRNKHAELFTIVDSNIDILTIAETKLDCSFPTAQFLVDRYKEPARKDRSKHGGGLLVYVKEDIPSCLLTDHPPVSDLLDLVVIELNFRKQKWLLLSIYISSINRSLFYEQLSSVTDYYSQSYKNIVSMGDFNTQPNDKNFQAFYQSHDLYNLIKNKTCFKSPSGTCIDLIFTNKKRSFKNTCAIDTGVSDFHRMVFTQLKLTLQKLLPKTIFYRDYKHFVKENFENDLIVGLLSNPHVSYSYTQFSLTFESALSIHAPIKQRKVRGTQMPVMTKALRQAIMRRSRLFSIFTKSKKRSDWENFIVLGYETRHKRLTLTEYRCGQEEILENNRTLLFPKI